MALALDLGTLPETIGSIAELVRLLEKESRPSGYTDAMLRFKPSAEEALAFAHWDRRHYTRQCIHSSPSHELLLICYEAGQRTSIHDYDSQMAWIKPVLGNVREERFKVVPGSAPISKGVKFLAPGALSYMGHGNPVHRHSNPGPGRAITVNLYSRPIRRWRVYDLRTGAASLSGPPSAAAE